MEIVQILILSILWMLSGFFVALLMVIADYLQIKQDPRNISFWIKNDNEFRHILAIVFLFIAAPIALFLGVVVLADIISKLGEKK